MVSETRSAAFSSRCWVVLLILVTSGCGDSLVMSEAKNSVANYMSTRITHCEDTWLYKYPGASDEFAQVKDFKWEIKEEPLTEGDRLNGVDFSGKVTITQSTKRMAPTLRPTMESMSHYDLCWSKWLDVNDMMTFQLVRTKGIWQYEPVSFTDARLLIEQAANCSEVVSIKECA